MKLNPRIEEKEYRKLKDRLSYSGIKLFDNDRKRFYQEFIMGDIKPEKSSIAKTLGSLVHCYLAEQKFDDKFHLMSSIEPKGQMKELIDAMYLRCLRSVVDGIQTDKFEVIFSDAVQEVKYDYNLQEVKFKGKDASKILGMFIDSDAEMYYKEMISCIGKEVVSESMDKRAEDICNTLKSHSYTYEYTNAKTGGDIEVFNELPVFFEYEGVPYKSMIDKLTVDHKWKTIQPLDWKTSWNSEEPIGAYLKFGYYLQGAMYSLALEHWKKEHGLDDYTVLPMIFVFCDTGAFNDPVLLTLSQQDVEAGKNGFSLRGWKYNGLLFLMDEIAWCVEHSTWTTTREIQRNNGKVRLELEYEIAG